MNKTILIVLIILVVIVGGYFLLKGGYQAPAPAPAPTAPAEQVAPEPEGIVPAPEEVAVPTPPSVKEFTVSGTEFNFNPSSITVSAGERVKITFRNNGAAPHNLTIEGLGIATRTIGGGQTDTIEFTAQTSGTYTFFCSVPGHRAAGMKGNLKVE